MYPDRGGAVAKRGKNGKEVGARNRGRNPTQINKLATPNVVGKRRNASDLLRNKYQGEE